MKKNSRSQPLIGLMQYMLALINGVIALAILGVMLWGLPLNGHFEVLLAPRTFRMCAPDPLPLNRHFGILLPLKLESLGELMVRQPFG